MNRGVGRLIAVAVRTDPTERRRERLLVVAVAGCGMCLIGAAAIAGLTGDTDSGSVPDRLVGLAPYLGQAGLRGGVVFGAVLLVVPFVVFAVQVLRLGTAARQRRLAAIRLTGATRGDLRRIAAAEGIRPGLVGSSLAGPAYLVLWLLLGLLLPRGYRLLPPLSLIPLLTWPALVPALTAASAAAAALAVRPAAVDPLTGSRRTTRPLGRRGRVLLGVLALALLAAMTVLPIVVIGLVVALAISAGPALVALAGRISLRRPDVVSVLAGHRLLADPGTPGRVAGVLLAVGLATGIAVAGIGSLLDEFVLRAGDRGDNLRFYLGGYLVALAGIGLAMVVAALSLVVGATEQVLDHRRPTAVLVALGVPPRTIRQILRRQLTLAATLPAGLGAICGWLLGQVSASAGALAFSFAALPLAVLLAGGTAALGARLVVRLLRGTLAEASSVENLRTA
jgi:hypothetical protein